MSVRTIRCQFIIIVPLEDNSVSVHHYETIRETIRCQFIIIASLASSRCQFETIRCQFIIRRQFGVSSSLLLPLHQVGKLDSWEDFRRQFGVDNSVSVHHYCFPCIKSVSWIHGKTSKTDRR